MFFSARVGFKMKRAKGKEIRLYFTGGGTGGHVFPGIAVAQEWSRRMGIPMENLLWIGSGKGFERDIISRFHLRYKAICSGKLRRYFSFQNFFDLFKIGFGFFQIFFFFLFKRPDIVFSKGGYVSVPPCLAAKILRIPFITHESDMTPGFATRINSRFAQEVLTAYPETCNMIRKGVLCKAVGNPVRQEMLQGDPLKGREIAKVPEGRPVVLVLGGSLGALGVNRLVDEARKVLGDFCYFIHQTGEKNYSFCEDVNCIKFPFFAEEFPHILACADIVVSRAGAGTLWENMATRKPAILLPLGTESSRGDQIINAHYFEKLGVAIVLNEETVTGELLAERVKALLTNVNLREMMKEKLTGFTKESPAVLICNEILFILNDTLDDKLDNKK